MTRFFRYAPTATLAAFLITVFETLRLLALDTVVLGGARHFVGVFLAIAGLVGFPLCLAGTALLLIFPVARWAFAKGWPEAVEGAISGPRRLAWCVYARGHAGADVRGTLDCSEVLGPLE